MPVRKLKPTSAGQRFVVRVVHDVDEAGGHMRRVATRVRRPVGSQVGWAVES